MLWVFFLRFNLLSTNNKVSICPLGVYETYMLQIEMLRLTYQEVEYLIYSSIPCSCHPLNVLS